MYPRSFLSILLVSLLLLTLTGCATNEQVGYTDTDRDGVADQKDAFPDDPERWLPETPSTPPATISEPEASPVSSPVPTSEPPTPLPSPEPTLSTSSEPVASLTPSPETTSEPTPTPSPAEGAATPESTPSPPPEPAATPSTETILKLDVPTSAIYGSNFRINVSTNIFDVPITIQVTDQYGSRRKYWERPAKPELIGTVEPEAFTVVVFTFGILDPGEEYNVTVYTRRTEGFISRNRRIRITD